ncbi:MAG TPA: hypothetical protein VKF82_10885 [Candidatus Eremiobacteraceae bacterium]|nr:hypothetical protein [Candidatus Eremiobacteraceae bacterium]
MSDRTARFSIVIPARNEERSCRKFDHLGDWYLLRNAPRLASMLGGHNEGEANHFFYDFPR